MSKLGVGRSLSVLAGVSLLASVCLAADRQRKGQAEVISVREWTYAYVSTETTNAKRDADLGALTQKMIAAIQAGAVKPTGPFVITYRGAGPEPDKPYQLDVGVSVARGSAVPADLKIIILPATDCASLTVTGKSPDYAAAYVSLYKKIESVQATPSDISRQVLTRWNGPDSARNVIEVRVELAKPAVPKPVAVTATSRPAEPAGTVVATTKPESTPNTAAASAQVDLGHSTATAGQADPTRLDPNGALVRPMPTDTFVYVGPYGEERPAPLLNALKGFADLRAQLAELNGELQTSRGSFFRDYRDGRDTSGSRRAFAEALYKKDMVIAYSSMMGDKLDDIQQRGRRGMTALTGNIDGGIPSSAQTYFEDWLRAIKAEGEAKPDPNLPTSAQFYESYRVERDWAEFDRQQLTPRPADYLAMLIQRYPNPKDNADLRDTVAALTELFGAQTLLDAAKAVQALPKSPDGLCQNVETLHLSANSTAGKSIAFPGEQMLEPTHPYAVWVALLGRDDPMKRFYAERYFGTHRSPDGRDWVDLRNRCAALKLAYGDRFVSAYAQAVFDGKPPTPFSDDANGSLRSMVISLDHCKTEQDLTAAMAKYDACPGGHARVVEVGQQILKMSLAHESFKDIGDGDDDAGSAFVSLLFPHKPNNLHYLAWTGFPVGSRVRFACKRENASTLDIEFELLKVDTRRATLAIRHLLTEKDGSHPRPQYDTYDHMAVKDFSNPNDIDAKLLVPGVYWFADRFQSPEDEPRPAFNMAAPPAAGYDDPTLVTFGGMNLHCAIRKTIVNPNRPTNVETR